MFSALSRMACSLTKRCSNHVRNSSQSCRCQGVRLNHVSAAEVMAALARRNLVRSVALLFSAAIWKSRSQILGSPEPLKEGYSIAWNGSEDLVAGAVGGDVFAFSLSARVIAVIWRLSSLTVSSRDVWLSGSVSFLAGAGDGGRSFVDGFGWAGCTMQSSPLMMISRGVVGMPAPSWTSNVRTRGVVGGLGDGAGFGEGFAGGGGVNGVGLTGRIGGVGSTMLSLGLTDRLLDVCGSPPWIGGSLGWSGSPAGMDGCWASWTTTGGGWFSWLGGSCSVSRSLAVLDRVFTGVRLQGGIFL